MRNRTMAMALVAATMLAACGGGDDDTGTSQTDAATQTEATTAATESDTSAETETSTDGQAEATVAVASSELGDILVDGEGMTLYGFLPDEGGTPTCTEGCAENWPPLAGPASAGEGVDDALLSTADHPSGMTMVVYGDWPLYYFAGDQQAGDVNGQGVGDNWYAVSPDGSLIQEASATESSVGDSY